MNKSTQSTDRGGLTRNALIQTALAEFADKGFHAASTRLIADGAQVNQALIGYHFGSKEGLYLAVFSHICEQVRKRIGPLADQVEARLDVLDDSPAAHEERLALILRLIEGLATTMLGNSQSDPWAQLILHEQQAPTQAFELLYTGYIGRLLTLLSRLLQQLRPQDDAEQIRLRVATMLGQVLMFRAGHAATLRFLGWETITPTRLEAILSQVRANVRAELGMRRDT